MPRNSSGTYSLPAGNPVVTATVISSAWANSTLTDLATAVTDSLSRSNQGGMLASLQLFDGAIGASGLSWSTEPTSGLYRAAANDFRWAIAGVDVLRWTGSLFTTSLSNVFTKNRVAVGDYTLRLSAALPYMQMNETDASANNKAWSFYVEGERLLFDAINDAELAATSWLIVDRTGIVVDSIALSATALNITGISTFLTSATSAGAPVQASSSLPSYRWNETDAAANNRLWGITVNSEQFYIELLNDAANAASVAFVIDRTLNVIDTINFPNGTLQYGGREVGLASPLAATHSANFTVAVSEMGKIVYVFTPATAVTMPNGIAFPAMVTIINDNSGSITIAASGAGGIYWYAAGGTRIGPATRTVANASVVTLFTNDGSNWGIWGAGIS